MASSGSFNTSGYDGRYLKFEWSVASQSTSSNSTKINWSLKGDGGDSYSWYMAGNFKVTIDGATVYSNSNRIQLSKGTVVASGSYTLNHNSSGKKSFSAYAEAGIYTYAVNCSGSGSWNLPDIARAATIKSAPDFNDTQSPTVTYSNPAGTAVSTLQIAIVSPSNESTVYAAYRDISKTGSSYTFNFTQAELNGIYTATANSKTLPVRFKIKTVIGNTTLYSNADKTLTMVDCYPVFNAAYLDTKSQTVAATGNNQLIVRNNSTLRVNVTNASTFKGATVTTAKAVVLGATTTANITNGSATLDIGTVDTAQDFDMPVTVTDSRGYTSTITLEVKVLNWTAPTAIITLARHNNYYSETDLKVDADYADEIQNNVLTIQARYKKTSLTTWSSYITLQDNVTQQLTLDNTFAWDVQVVVSDNFGSTTYNLVLNRGMPLAFFDDTKSSAAINGFPNYEEAFEVFGRLFVNNEDIVSKFTGIGGIAREAPTNNWNTACGTLSGLYMGSNMTNAPGNSANWFFVLHIAHNNLYQRQLAFDFFGLNIYTRRMDNGNWSSWQRIDMSATYNTSEIETGEWIDGKPVYQKTIDLGSLPNAASKNVAHGITNLDKVVKLDGTATNSSGRTIPLPYITGASSTDSFPQCINLQADKTNVTVGTLAADRSSYTGYATIHYTKNEETS